MSSLLEWLQLENNWHRGVRQKKDQWLRAVAQLAHSWHISANAVSLLGLIIGIVSAVVLVWQYWFGVALLVVSAVCDGLDGTLARLSKRTSVRGARIDYYADVTVTSAVFVATAALVHDWRWLAGFGCFLAVIGVNQWRGLPLRLAPNRMVLMLCLLLGLPRVGLALVSAYAIVMGVVLIITLRRRRRAYTATRR